ncbi:MAG: helicase C-terminal domain-containing protein [Halobacteriales archaeon]|nr:helicase C-terminal domain-containing protein [Halobacteriales archaeon]
MTYEHRDETLPKVARTIVRLMAAHTRREGADPLLTRYAIAERTRRRCSTSSASAAGVRPTTRTTATPRCSAWKRATTPSVFVSVKMEEALDLEGDLCRWQVLCKAPYPNTRDSRVARRLEDDQWAWYYRTALRTVIQACGRIVRAPDDYGATYLADSSLLDVFERARADTPAWFREQIDAMEQPELPPFDPGAANADASPTRSYGSDATETSETDTTSGSKSLSDHPLGDVWGTD